MDNEEDLLKSLPKDAHVTLALIVRDMQHLTKSVDANNGLTTKFLDLIANKVDTKLYMQNNDHLNGRLDRHDTRILKLENEQENGKLVTKAKQEEREKILGLTRGTWLVIIQVFQILALLGYIGSQT
jgi:hypothetical protein